ncbi:MAG TPA: sulfurtransferase [Smithellaceae bacterium]|jgi:thiosulfate/3-mercaptopyruvate sulfurtransferase|nr:sulfurtransferase [Syntrophaceae bacterium]NMC92196.1 sulfurtransferase [Smithella sp.]OQC74134.1 MAG: putative thiosulfate sulfurtransferase [Deltaproteobacteria bacterium ADurb.Bin002]HNV56575.1 sulfurtransferase [Smithellaceae bacterium]MBP8665610.1 sulfurtransferase [Syntrophaceae bacterium]
MKRNLLLRFVILASFIILLPTAGLARDIAPIVSTDWLLANLKNPKLVILDIRRVEDYREGHIPGALNAFYGAWAYMKDGLYASLPEKDEIDDTISYMGIHFDQWVVVTGCMDTPRLSYQSARVACTLQYAGIENVALLDGGMNKWIAEKKPLSKKIERRPASKFKGKYTSEKFADKHYIEERMGKLILLDLREREFFTGEKKMDCVPMRGHIPGAFNMPTSCAFNEDRTFKTKEELRAIAEEAAGKDLNAAIVTYCDAGQCCPTWSYLLMEVLGYKNVRLYVGSMQEWMQDPRAPVER